MDQSISHHIEKRLESIDEVHIKNILNFFSEYKKNKMQITLEDFKNYVDEQTKGQFVYSNLVKIYENCPTKPCSLKDLVKSIVQIEKLLIQRIPNGKKQLYELNVKKQNLMHDKVKLKSSALQQKSEKQLLLVKINYAKNIQQGNNGTRGVFTCDQDVFYTQFQQSKNPIFNKQIQVIPQTLKFHMEDQEGKILGHCIHDITKLVPETENPFIETLLNENKKLTEIQLSFSVQILDKIGSLIDNELQQTITEIKRVQQLVDENEQEFRNFTRPWSYLYHFKTSDSDLISPLYIELKLARFIDISLQNNLKFNHWEYLFLFMTFISLIVSCLLCIYDSNHFFDVCICTYLISSIIDDKQFPINFIRLRIINVLYFFSLAQDYVIVLYYEINQKQIIINSTDNSQQIAQKNILQFIFIILKYYIYFKTIYFILIWKCSILHEEFITQVKKVITKIN